MVKALMRNFGLFLVGSLVGGGFIAWAVVIGLQQDGTFMPLSGTGFTEHQVVQNRVVEIGGSIIVLGVEKCSDRDIFGGQGTERWRRVSGRSLIIGATVGSPRFTEGCRVNDFENPLPPNITPGTWVFEGSTCVFENDDAQCVAWQTQTFEVIDG